VQSTPTVCDAFREFLSIERNEKELKLNFDIITLRRNNMASYLSVLHIATAGLNGPLLGTDEEEVVLMVVVVIDVPNNQVTQQLTCKTPIFS
jgi:hypothetical protein